MKVLLIGSGGREHAIAWKLAQSPRLTKLYTAPGNPGTAALYGASQSENVNLRVDDHLAIARFCKEAGINLVVIGPEAPLAAGLADHLLKDGLRVFGPRKAAAQIEASKAFAKQFMGRHNIPTARFAPFNSFPEAVKFLGMVDFPVVIKASGLAAGKGVFLPEDRAESVAILEKMLVKNDLGVAGREVVIEERLSGDEVSLMAFTDGRTVRPMLPAQDYKRLLEGDRGPNTGGMGAFAPAPTCPAEVLAQVTQKILVPAINGLRHDGNPFVGVLFAGLMLTAEGPKVLEFNCRFGDPETQAVLPLLETDLLEVLEACVSGRLREVEIKWRSESAVCVVVASDGYPGRLVYGKLTTGSRHPISNGVCFQAGTRLEGGQIVTAGGRVFGITSWAGSLEQAVQRVYASIENISFEGMQYRPDIARRALQAATKIAVAAQIDRQSPEDDKITHISPPRLSMFDSPHRRFNPLTREWVLVSPHRAKRPWLGQVEKTPPENLPHYDPTCYLCPDNKRAGDIRNPPYTGTFVFDNDFAALLPEAALAEPVTHPLFSAEPESGLCRVICFSPRHDLSLPELPLSEVEAVIRTWTAQTADLGSRPDVNYVQVFENKGAVMGCSNPHPHSQVWATNHIPNEPAKELASQGDHFAQHGRPLLLDYLAEEQKRGERIIAANEHFTALVPFWAIWPFEVLLIAHRPAARLMDLTAPEVSALADVFHKVTARYDNLFEISFPYSMGFHQAPTDDQPHPEWVLHAHFYPPLLRSAAVRKFMVGYEMLAQPQRDITPETASARLRELPEVHYKHA